MLGGGKANAKYRAGRPGGPGRCVALRHHFDNSIVAKSDSRGRGVGLGNRICTSGDNESRVFVFVRVVETHPGWRSSQ